KLASTASGNSGAVVTVSSVLDLSESANQALGQQLVSALDSSPRIPQVDVGLGELTSKVDEGSKQSVVVALETSINSGVPVSAGEGITFGLDFGTTQKVFTTISAYIHDAHQSYQGWGN